MLAIAISIVVGLVLALVLLIGPAAGGSEPTVTGSVLLAFGLGWALMWLLTRRFSGQPQEWMRVPAAALGLTGLVLIVLQPGPSLMDLLSWIWPVAIVVLAVWMLIQVRRQLHSRGRWLVVPLIVFLLLLAVAGGLATVAAAVEPKTPPGVGQLVDVGGHRLYIECAGSGGPAVVLQSGAGGDSTAWKLIAPVVAKSTHVCVYDRAGHGRSDEAGPQDGNAVAADLHALLQAAGVPGPYVLAGHSTGGPYVRIFTARYPDEVAGVVLLDPQPADAFTSLPDYPGIYTSLKLTYGLGPSLGRLGLLGLLLGVPANEATVAIARGARDEINSIPATLQEAQQLTSFGDRPLIVVTAGSDQQRGWIEAGNEMAKMSTNSAHRVFAQATHDSLISGADAPASARAILDVVAAVVNGGRVS